MSRPASYGPLLIWLLGAVPYCIQGTPFYPTTFLAVTYYGMVLLEAFAIKRQGVPLGTAYLLSLEYMTLIPPPDHYSKYNAAVFDAVQKARAERANK